MSSSITLTYADSCSAGHTHSWHGHALIPSGFKEFGDRVKFSFPAPDWCICLIIFFTRRSGGKFSLSDNGNGHTGTL